MWEWGFNLFFYTRKQYGYRFMIPDEKTIKSRSMSVYKALSNLLRCTFDELQNQCKLGTTELCLSIARLMQERKIRQEREGDNVYYMLAY